MALTDQQRRRVAAEFVDEYLDGAACTLTKAELHAAADALDAWLTANATALNQALPAGFRARATAGQKAALLIIIARRRFGA